MIAIKQFEFEFEFERRNSIAIAMELRVSCNKPSICNGNIRIIILY